MDGVALCWRDGQAVYIPIHGQPPELLSELVQLFGSPKLEKATFALKQQLAALLRAFGPRALGGGGGDGGGGGGNAAGGLKGQKSKPLTRLYPLPSPGMAAHCRLRGRVPSFSSCC